MALEKCLFSFVLTTQLLALLCGVSALSDITFVENAGQHVDRQGNPNTRQKNLMNVLQLLLNEPGKRRLDSLTEETSPPSMASLLTSEEADGLVTLLDKLFLSPSLRDQQQQQQAGSAPQRASDDQVFHVLTSKRAREHLSGAMPPINEFCRLMNVQCY